MLGVVSSFFNELVDPGSVDAGEWTRLAIFFGVQVVLWLLLWLRTPVELVLTVAVLLDATLLAATLALDSAPDTGATTFIVLTVIVGYFVRPRWGIALSAVFATMVAIIGPSLEGWDDDGPIPTISVAILLTGIAMAYISSRMRADEARLQQLVEEQVVALERLRVVNAIRDTLIANVSHELRTPLTTTVGAIDTLLRTDIEIDEAQREQLLTLARTGGIRLTLLVEDLLTLGSTRPDSLELSATPGHLGDIVEEAVAGLDAGSGRTIRLDRSSDPLVRMDRPRMVQVVSNLVVNAVNHGAGDIDVRTAVAGEHALLQVLDDGNGVAPEHVDELFMPFARFSTRADSTGLGLAICRAIVEAHGGSIAYRRTDTGRTAFEVQLPLETAA